MKCSSPSAALRLRTRPLSWTLLLLTLVLSAPVWAEDRAHAEEIEAWRANRLERLTAEDGWLTLVGLFWLEEGENSIGSSPDAKIRLPEDKAPSEVGSISFDGEKVELRVVSSVDVRHEGARVESLELADDSTGSPTLFRLGDLSGYVIRRGDQRALRVKDRNHPARASVSEIDSYAIDSGWRIEGRFDAAEQGRTIPIPTVLGTINQSPSSGTVVFDVEGETHRLDVLAESGDEEMFIIFADKTSGRETYGGGRYLYAKAPDADGKVVVDFNKAYNPPCVFTAYATCPLPPRQNRLAIVVDAGEKMHGKKY